MATAPESDGRRTAAAVRRRAREQDIIAATRGLFDQRGVRDAQIEDIAKAVGINRAIVYRHFTGKEELFALTLVGYLDELREALEAAGTAEGTLTDKVAATIGAFVDYGVEHPAFSDCAQALMRRTGPELFDEISEGAMLRLGRAMTGCLSILTRLIDEGNAAGEFHVENPALLANTLYASGLGTLQLARIGITVTEAMPGVPVVGQLSVDQVRDYMTKAALAMLR